MAPKKAADQIKVATPEPTPEPKTDAPEYAPDDNSIDARMWRLLQDHKRMGSRK